MIMCQQQSAPFEGLIHRYWTGSFEEDTNDGRDLAVLREVSDVHN